MLLLKVGMASMLFALTLAAAVVVAVNLPGAEEPAGTPVASAEPRAAETPLGGGEPRQQPQEEEEEEAAETAAEPGERDAPPRSVDEADDEPKPPEEALPRSSEEPRAEQRSGEPRAMPTEEPREAQPEQPRAEPSEEQREEQTLPVLPEDMPPPSPEEVAAADEPRHYPPQPDAQLTLTVEAMGIHDAPVRDSTSARALAGGVVHIPETPMPWDELPQKNVYLAAHRVGSPGTASRTIFYNLDELSGGDSVVLKDRSGNAYGYRVTEVFVVEPDAGWVLDPVRGRDMLTLQTCTYPGFENRLIVRADRDF
jgi:sortase A